MPSSILTSSSSTAAGSWVRTCSGLWLLKMRLGLLSQALALVREPKVSTACAKTVAYSLTLGSTLSAFSFFPQALEAFAFAGGSRTAESFVSDRNCPPNLPVASRISESFVLPERGFFSLASLRFTMPLIVQEFIRGFTHVKPLSLVFQRLHRIESRGAAG